MSFVNFTAGMHVNGRRAWRRLAAGQLRTTAFGKAAVDMLKGKSLLGTAATLLAANVSLLFGVGN
jgi:hypothetical protein